MKFSGWVGMGRADVVESDENLGTLPCLAGAWNELYKHKYFGIVQKVGGLR